MMSEKGNDTLALIASADFMPSYGAQDRSGTSTATVDIEGMSTSGAHCHGSYKKAGVDSRARRKLIMASILCLLFMVGEATGGAIAGSLAIMTDAAHLLTDFASFLISLAAIFLATRPATKKMSFGWYRAEVVGALVSVLMIWVVTGILVYMAILRVIEEDYQIDGLVMLITSAIGVGVNILMACTLHQHGHGHGHGHGHSHGGKSKENINVRAAFIHVIGDFVQSIGVLTAALVIYFKPEYKIADPICTFIFSALVLFTTVSILRDTLTVLMEGSPSDLDFNEIKKSLYDLEGVIEVHNLRMWSLTVNTNAMSVHLAIDTQYSSQDILTQATKVMKETFEFHDVTIQMENYVEEMADCTQCKEPTR